MTIDSLSGAPNTAHFRWSSRLIGSAALVQLAAMAGGMWRLAGGDAIRLPRIDGWEATHAVVVPIFAAWAVGAAAFVSARRIQPAGWLLPLALVVAMSLDEQIGGGHLYLVAIASPLLVGYAWAVAKPGTTRVAAMLLWALQAQITIVLFWAAVGKINAVFLSGGVLRASLVGYPFGLPEWALRQTTLRILALLIVSVEFFMAVGLWLPRWRTSALMLAVFLHVGIVVLMTPKPELFAFGLAMAAGYVLFLPKRTEVVR